MPSFELLLKYRIHIAILAIFIWLNRWIASTLAMLGLVVASMQHFNGWKKIMAGEFTWGDYWYANAWVLSGCALFIITGLILYLWAWRPVQPSTEEA